MTDPIHVLHRRNFQHLLDALASRGYRIVGPTVRDGAIVYDEIHTASDLPEGWTDQQDGGTYRLTRRDDAAVFGYAVGPHSWKKFLFPPRTRLWQAERDDGAGLAAATRLRAVLSDDVRVLAKEGDFASLLDDWQGADAVVVIDATSSGTEPGTIRQYDAHIRPLPSACSRSSTHSFGVAEAIELARALGRLPARVVVFGIEGCDFTPGEGLSPAVDAAVNEVVKRVTREATGGG
jgi:hydrogenase maturation protease